MARLTRRQLRKLIRESIIRRLPEYVTDSALNEASTAEYKGMQVEKKIYTGEGPLKGRPFYYLLLSKMMKSKSDLVFMQDAESKVKQDLVHYYTYVIDIGCDHYIPGLLDVPSWVDVPIGKEVATILDEKNIFPIIKDDLNLKSRKEDTRYQPSGGSHWGSREYIYDHGANVEVTKAIPWKGAATKYQANAVAIMDRDEILDETLRELDGCTINDNLKPYTIDLLKELNPELLIDEERGEVKPKPKPKRAKRKSTKGKKQVGDIPSYSSQEREAWKEDIYPMSLEEYENIPEAQKKMIKNHGFEYWCERFPDHPRCEYKG